MLKIAGRVFIIVLLAVVVALGWYAFSTTSSAASMVAARMHGPAGLVRAQGSASDSAQTGETTTNRLHERRQGFGSGEGEAGFSPTRALPGIARTVGLTLVMTLVVVLVGRLKRRLQPASVNVDDR
jgi:hypothetical protein